MKGGQIPGIPKKILDLIVKKSMTQLAQAAMKANEGALTPMLEKYLPPVAALPKEFVTSVANGNLLPCQSLAFNSSLFHFSFDQGGDGRRQAVLHQEDRRQRPHIECNDGQFDK